MSTILVLSNSNEINLEDGSSLGNIRVLSPDKTRMIEVWDKLTDKNLKVVQMKTDGALTGEFTDLTCDGESSTQMEDGSILTNFKIRQKTELEILRERVAALEEGQGVQDGAIDDLGVVTSTLAEQIEGGTQ